MSLCMKKIVLLLMGATVLTACQPQNSSAPTEVATVESTTVAEEAEIEVTIDIIVEDEIVNKGEQTFKVAEGANLLDVMKEHFEIVEKDGFFSKINDHAQDEKENIWWLYDVNGKMAEVGANEFILSDGDHVEWKLTAFE